MQCRWFLVHALANAIIVLTGLHALTIVFTDPHNALDSRVYGDSSFFGDSSSWPLTFVNAVHICESNGLRTRASRPRRA